MQDISGNNLDVDMDNITDELQDDKNLKENLQIDLDIDNKPLLRAEALSDNYKYKNQDIK